MTTHFSTFDDRTALSLCFEVKIATLEGVLALTQEWATEHGIARDDALSLRLVLDELLSNICMHAPVNTKVELRLELHTAPPETAEKDMVRLILTDTGPPFNPFNHPGTRPLSLQDSNTGGRGLTLVRLLSTETHWQRVAGGNRLHLSLPLGTAEQQTPDAPTAPALPDIRTLRQRIRSLWSESLALRQTVFFTLSAMLCIWGAMALYYAEAGTQRLRSAEVLVFQALHTQSVISSTFLQRVATGLESLAHSLPPLPEGTPPVEPDFLLHQLWYGAALRSLTAEIPVLGVVAGYGGRTWLYRIEDGGIQRQEMHRDLAALISPKGSPPRWESLYMTFQANDPHAAMLYGLPLAPSGRPEDGWIGTIITMPWIAATLKGLSGFKDAVPMYFDGTGRYIIFPAGRQLRDGPQRLAEEAQHFPQLATAEQHMLAGEKALVQLTPAPSGVMSPWPLPWQGHTSLAFMPLTIPGWHLALLISSAELGDAPLPLPPAFLVAAVLGPLCIGCFTWQVTSTTLRPLHQLANELERFSKGDLNTRFSSARYRDEVGMMLHTFERVRITLKQSLHNLVYTAAAQQRILNQLTLARHIQHSMLPHAFPHWEGASGQATIQIAREVCGDLYDCFVFGDEERLCLVMGDVCGKGVPAAIIMSRTMTLARAFLLEGLSPGQVLERLNTALLRRDNAHMFVTLLVGLLDKEGVFIWAAAGHPPPLPGPEPKLHSEDFSTAPLTALPWSGELVLGIRPAQTYTNFSLRLLPGQSLLLYTDGLDEAMGTPVPGTEQASLYGEARLLHAFAQACHQEKEPEHILAALLADHARHRNDTPLADDMSCMVITRTEPSGTAD